MPHPRTETTRARVLVPPVAPDRLDGDSLVQGAIRLAELAGMMTGEDDMLRGLSALGERIFLHSEDAPRRALLARAAKDPELSLRLMDQIFPAIARRLESGWADDRLSFVDVTIAATRMQEALRRMGRFVLPPAERPAVALIVPAWEQHGLAAAFAAREMRHHGAPVRMMVGLDRHQLAAMIERYPAAALMFSIGSCDAAARLPSLIETLRRSVPRALPVVVGGPSIVADRDVLCKSGANLVTNDVAAALGFCDIPLHEGGRRSMSRDA